MGIVFGLLAATAYGISDFAAGVASRRLAAGPVTAIVQGFAILASLVGVLLFPGDGLSGHAVAWGLLAGLGSGLGTLTLYRGLEKGAMSPVATSSAVLAAVVPAIVGVLSGETLSAMVTTGIVLAVPAIGLVSWQGGATTSAAGPSGLGYGVLAGLGFAPLFLSLDRAGTESGAWPLVPASAVAFAAVLPFARAGGSVRRVREVLPLAAAGGVLGGTANLLFLAATGAGQLAVVAVLTSLYPAITIVLARILLAELWSRTQVVGLLAAAGAVVLVTAG